MHRTRHSLAISWWFSSSVISHFRITTYRKSLCTSLGIARLRRLELRAIHGHSNLYLLQFLVILVEDLLTLLCVISKLVQLLRAVIHGAELSDPWRSIDLTQVLQRLLSARSTYACNLTSACVAPLLELAVPYFVILLRGLQVADSKLS